MTRIASFLAFCLVAGTPAFSQDRGDPSQPHIALYKKVSPAVVYVRGGGQKGSGVLVHPSGIILTSPSACGTSSSSTVRVRTKAHKEYRAKVLGRLNDKELVVLKIEGDAPFAHVEFGNSDRVKLGQVAYSFGDSFGSLYRDAQVHMSLGVISGRYRITKSKSRRAKYRGTVIETSAAVNQNQDGGPLVDRRGRLIGLITLNYHESKFTGIAVPINELKADILRIAPSLEPVVGLPRKGVPWMGAVVRETEDGIIVRAVYTNGPARKGGLRKGDLITKIDNKKVLTKKTFQRRLSALRPGDTIRIRVIREGKTLVLSVTLTKKPMY